MAISASQLLGLVEIRGAAESIAKLEGVGRATDSAGAKLAGLAVGGAVLAGAALVGLGVAAIKMDADLQQGVNRLRTGAGDATDSFNSLRSGIQQAAIATGVMTGPLTQAMYLIISSGQRGAQAMDTLTVAAKGAQIEQANVVDVANVVSGAMHNFGTSVFSASDYMNGLMKAVSLGKISLQDLSTSMGPLEPLAHQLGISYNDLSAAMTTQTNAMIPAARAATSLRFMMQSLEVPTKKAKAEMAAMGLNSVAVGEEMKKSLPGALQMIYDAAKRAGPEGSVPFNRAFSDMIGGQRSLSAALALTGTHMKDFVGNSKAIADAMDTGKGNVNGWAIAQSNLNVQLDKGRAMLQVLGQNAGEVLLPYVSQLLGMVTPLIAQFGQWATSTQGLAGDINQLAAFVTYLYQDVQANGAIKEFGAILSDIGSTVNNVVNTALSLLGTIFGTTASQAGKASDAATNVANGFKRVLDVIKPLTDAAAWLTQQFADSGVKGTILRDVLITVGGAIAGIKIAEFGSSFVTAMTNAGAAALGFGQKMVGVQAAATAASTATASAGTAAVASGTAFGGMGASAAALGTALGPLIAIAAGVTVALQAIPTPAFMAQMGIHNFQQAVQSISLGDAVQRVNEGNREIQQHTQQMALIASRNFETMYKNATDSTTRLNSGVTIAMNQLANGSTETINTMKGQITTDWFNMHKQVYSETQVMSSDAVAAMTRLNGDMTDQAASMDANVIGYWNDVAAYIAGHPINGNITYTTQGIPGAGPGGSVGAPSHHFASGTSFAPGGPSLLGEGREAELVVGPHLMNIPRGAGIYPMSQLGGGGSGGQPVQVNINIAGHNVARVLLPELVTAIRNHTAAKF